MQDLARTIMWFVPILHCVFALYIFGNTQIFFELKNYDSSELKTESKYFLKKFYERAFYEQNIAITGVLLFILAIIIIRLVLWKPFIKCAKKCCGKKYKEGITKNKYRNVSYYLFMDKEKIEQELKLIDYYLTDDSTTDEKFRQILLDRQNELLNQKNDIDKGEKVGAIQDIPVD